MRGCTMAVGILLAGGLTPPPAAQAPVTQTIHLNGQTFTLPAGFTLELAAGPPLVDRPITAAFDEQGRLYVSEASGTNDPVQKQLAEKPHRILRLEDPKGNGRFGRRTVFADKMMLPEGTLWHDGSLYVAAPPSIWKLTDTDGDGVADERVEWLQGKTLTSCANDLHGPYLGPEGFIYWTKGAFAEQTYQRAGMPPLVTRAAHIFRARPDGSGLEPVITGGMDNPVAVAFTPGGEPIFTTTFLVHPGGGQRDGLIHAVYGGVYGKHQEWLDAIPRTRPDYLPALAHLGPAAPSGLARYEGAAFGADYRDNLFAALFNLRKVTRHRLRPRGATVDCDRQDFLVSDHPDFHPTDVLADADGSLLVIDTGGWYKLCCPTSQFHRPAALGGIYRIRRAGAAVTDPRGLKLNWPELSEAALATLFDDPRPAVRRRAELTLAKRGLKALPPLRTAMGSPTPAVRLQAVWCASAVGDPQALAVARAGLGDDDATVRTAALHVASAWRDGEAYAQVLRCLADPNEAVRRAAAETLGRLGRREAVPALLQALSACQDEFLAHSLTYALLELNDAEATAIGLRHPQASVRRAALVALDQMKAPLEPLLVAKETRSLDPATRDAAVWILGRHPEWGAALATWLSEQLLALQNEPAARAERAALLGRLARGAATQAFLAANVAGAKTPIPTRRFLLSAMGQAPLRELPDAWMAPLLDQFADTPELRADALAVFKALPPSKRWSSKLAASLVAFAQDDRGIVDERLAALSALPNGLASAPPAIFDLLLDQFAPDRSPGRRAAATAVLAQARLTPEQLLRLCDGLAALGPMELGRALEPFGLVKDDAVGRKLLAVLRTTPSRTSLRADFVKRLAESYSPAVQQGFAPLLAELDADAPKQRAKLEALLANMPAGDVQRGKTLFHSAKFACVSCHAIGYVGGKVGPDLTTIGKIRTERDLLEAIVFPSASFVRGYEPVVALTVDGKLHSGVVRRESADEVVLAVAADQEVRIPRSQLEEMRPGKVSLMPAGLGELLSERELADLVAFLKACK